ncbi:CaiB/BaiF CoA transferase family protein [Piscinibacter sakaiensis]|uniref:CaiB/BaiF CoA transferase family protein n=1 Tax=Piscinibacter sakaiensis TaxID=1547922 RepID=UPI003AAB8B7C
MKPLAGIQVLDFSTIFAGPHCGQLLADYGADVIKIEPLKGDDSRNWQPFHTGEPGSGTLFLVVNRNKRSVVVDLKSKDGSAIVRRMASNCDVVLQNFSAGVMERLGLGYRQLQELNPKLIYCTISAFGETGPLAHARGYDPMMQAFSGMMKIPQPGEPAPARINIPLIDFTTGQNAFSGILAAIIERQTTGRGSHVEACLADSAMALQAWGLQRAWAAQNTNAAPASAHAMSDNVPYESFEASDGWLFIACGNNKLWQQFCVAIERPELAEHPDYASNAGRRGRYDALMAILRPLLAARPRADWEQAFLAAGVPFAPVNTLLELGEHPQILASGIVQQYSSPEFGSVKTVARAVRFDGEIAPVGNPPPGLGAHTREVLHEQGFSDDEIDRFIAAKAVAAH